MEINPNAGKPAEPAMLVNVPKLIAAYYAEVPDPSVPAQRVMFGTSGHRGSSFDKAFNEWHILAISQAICLYRKKHKIDGPLFLGMDTHAAVPGIAFLSGGQLCELAYARLNAMNVRFKSRLPWALAFSFARAIQQPALEIWQGKETNVSAAQQALYLRAKCNRAARHGKYNDDIEKK